jgi:thymidylate synthase
LLRDEAHQPKPSPAAPKSLEELRTEFIHDKKMTFKKDGTPLDPDTISSYEKVTREFLDIIKKQTPVQLTKQDLRTGWSSSGSASRIGRCATSTSASLASFTSAA